MKTQVWSRCAAGLVAASLLGSACKSKDKEVPETQAESSAKAALSAKPEASAKTQKPKRDPKAIQERRKALLERMKKKRVEAKPVAKVKPTPDDPEKGDFTVKEATQGLGDEGQLVAEITTDVGKLSCELYEDKAPITVANFVGLARGNRPWKDGNKWVKKPLYNGTPFHRVIKGFMIQGGDPEGKGTGGPGYVIPDEIWENAKHDQRGLLCMANRGPNTNGSQFFILDGKAAHLDGGYTIFGLCEPEAVIEKIANTDVKGDRAVKPPTIKTVSIKRDKTKPKASAKDEGATEDTETNAAKQPTPEADKPAAVKPKVNAQPKAAPKPAASSKPY